MFTNEFGESFDKHGIPIEGPARCCDCGRSEESQRVTKSHKETQMDDIMSKGVKMDSCIRCEASVCSACINHEFCSGCSNHFDSQ